MNAIKSIFSSSKDKTEREERRGRDPNKESRRKSIFARSIFSDVDPILCSRENRDPTTIKKSTQATPKVIRRGSSKMRRSRKNAVGNSIAYMSTVSSVSYAGPVINYQYEFKLKYGTVPNYDED